MPAPNNHFAIVYSGIKIPAAVKKIKTVYKLERKFATEMTQSIYPQFHPSCIKAIKSLRPPTRPRTEAYSIKVRQHILSAACHAHLLVRPCISGKKLEQLKEDQKTRYAVQGRVVKPNRSNRLTECFNLFDQNRKPQKTSPTEPI